MNDEKLSPIIKDLTRIETGMKESKTLMEMAWEYIPIAFGYIHDLFKPVNSTTAAVSSSPSQNPPVI